jgi:hypothetical protein
MLSEAQSNLAGPAAAAGRDKGPIDLRFRALLGAAAWDGLPEAVQRRFAKRLTGTALALYAGEVIETRFSRLGWCLAQTCRLIGAPLPLGRDGGVPALVSVSEDRLSGGQNWTRIYGRKRGFPQVIRSAKRFAGSTGLEEHVGCGIGMALRVAAFADGLVFSSEYYFWSLGGYRVRLPAWLGPGRTVVTHCDLGGGRFAFDLSLAHRLFGELVHQHAIFHDL